MNPGVRLAAYGGALVLLGGAGWATGSAVGPSTYAAEPGDEHASMAGMAPAGAEATRTPSRTAQVAGYTVALAGDLDPGRPSPLTLTVSRDGEPVTDLEPHSGGYGHLVALREGDLAYLRTQPQDGPAGPELSFDVDVPSAGRYLLFLDFQHGGVVRTAEFTVATGDRRAEATTP